MLLLNFSHPITSEQRAQVKEISGLDVTEVYDIPVQMDNHLPFTDQIRALVDGIELTPQEWQSRPILINPPAFNFAALTLLAELHGRMGYFPAIIRVRPAEEAAVGAPPRFEIAEIINLQAVRDTARLKRKG